MKRITLIVMLCCVSTAMPMSWAQGDMASNAMLPQPAPADVVQSLGPDAKVDWSILQFRAVGIGLAPAEASGGRAKALAREAAITVAERNLLKIVQGVHITSETQVENLILVSDVIKTKLDGVLQGAVIVRETANDDGSYQVVLALPMSGEQSVAQAIELPELVDQAAPADEIALADVPAPKVVSGDFTGVLIDCRGLKLSPAMSPVIFGPESEAVYPREAIADDVIVKKGIVAYYTSLDAAKAAGRVGHHPLVIKASGINKDGDDLWYTSPIVTQADTASILAEDARSGFLAKLAVGFLVD